MATVINVKYIENVQQECAEPMLSNATPIEKEMLVNINCSIGIIIDYIREIAQLDEKGDSSGLILNAVPIVPERSTKSINDIVAKIRKQSKKQSVASVSKIIIV